MLSYEKNHIEAKHNKKMGAVNEMWRQKNRDCYRYVRKFPYDNKKVLYAI